MSRSPDDESYYLLISNGRDVADFTYTRADPTAFYRHDNLGFVVKASASGPVERLGKPEISRALMSTLHFATVLPAASSRLVRAHSR